MIFKKYPYLITLALLAGVSTYAQSTKLKVSILDFSGDEVPPKVLNACFQKLETSIIASNRFVVIAKDKREKILEEMKFQKSSGACDDAQCAVEIGKMVGADHLMFGEIIDLGGLYQINIKIVDMESAEVSEKVTREVTGNVGKLLDEIGDASREIVRRIATSGQPQFTTQQPGYTQNVAEKTYGSVDIISNPPGANILLDGIDMDVTPQTMDQIVTGPHNLVLVYPGYETLQKRIMVEDGKITSISEYLVPKTGSLSILSQPIEATVYLDEVPKGKTPLDISELLVKDYMIRLELENYEVLENRVTVQYNQNATQKYNLKPLPGTLNVISFPTNVNVSVGAKRFMTNNSGMASFQLPVGKHTIALSKKGYEPLEKMIQVSANDFQTLDISLTKIPAGVSSNPNMGFLTINTNNPNAKAKISGVKKPLDLPIEYFELKYGLYNLKGYAKGYETRKYSVQIDKQKTSKIELELIPKKRAKAFKYSAIFPGIGQYYAGTSKRGLIYSLSAMGMGALLVESIPDYYNDKRWMNNYRNDYLAATTADDIDATWQMYEHQVATVNSAKTKITLFTGVLVSSWLTSMIDAYFFSGLK